MGVAPRNGGRRLDGSGGGHGVGLGLVEGDQLAVSARVEQGTKEAVDEFSVDRSAVGVVAAGEVGLEGGGRGGWSLGGTLLDGQGMVTGRGQLESS